MLFLIVKFLSVSTSAILLSIPKRIESIFQLKDKSMHLSHVIYKDTCICGQTFIGETARNLKVRVNDHSDVNGQSEPAKHIIKHPNYKFSWDVLTTAHSWMNRKIEEDFISHVSIQNLQTSPIIWPNFVRYENWYYVADKSIKLYLKTIRRYADFTLMMIKHRKRLVIS